MDEPIIDLQERKLALDPTRSFIMQAPAGSGKTSVLTQRTLCLLANVEAPEQVVAITFTRKAAAEMRARIFSALKQAQHQNEPVDDYHKTTWQLAKKVLQRDRQCGWQLLDNPNRLRILTIDALCARITRAAPILTNFGAQPEVLSDPNSCYLKAARALLDSLSTNPPWSDSLIQIMLHLDNNQSWVEELLISMLARRDQWLPHVMNNHQREHLEAGLQNAVSDILQLCHEHTPKSLTQELLALYNFSADNLGNERIDYFPDAQLDSFKTWHDIAEFVFNKSGKLRKSATIKTGFPAQSAGSNAEQKLLFKEMKTRMLALLLTLSDHADFVEALSEVIFAPPLHYSDQQWQLIASLLEVLPILVAELHLQFKAHRAVDFIEIAQGAIRALGASDEPTQVALNLDYQIQHLLVDEFQDTSVTQYRLLELLTAGWQQDDGRTLFIVGDPMQSIYRFREAEVGLFLRSRHVGLGHIPLHYLQLQMNFRSQKSVIDWLNQHFVSIFPHEENIANGAVPYSESLAGDVTTSDSIKIHALFDGQVETEAMRVADIIQREREANPDGRIAILVRSRTHLREIIPELKRAQLRYQAVEVEKLSHCVVIRDLLSLTRALLHPHDRVAWLAVLRAPWCGLTLTDLHAIGNQFDKTIVAAAIDAKLSEDGQVRCQPVITILQNAMDQRQRMPLADWVRKTWQQLKGPECVQSDGELDNANTFFKLLSELDQNALLPEISEVEQKLDQLFASPDPNADARLQIMTIHKAKGLEFDTVIIPSLQRRPAIDEASLLLWQERPRRETDQADLIMAPIKYAGDDYDPIYRHVRRQHNQKGYYESIRLLYVALTRAKSRLHLLGTLADDQSVPASQSFLGLLWNAVQDAFIEQPIVEAVEQAHAANEKLLQRLSVTDLAEPPVIQAAQKTTNHLELNLDETASKVGTVIHRILQDLSDHGIEQWQNNQYNFDHLLLSEKIPLAKIKNATNTIETAINNMLADEQGRWILDNKHIDAHSEYPVSLFEDGQVHHYVIDRTFIDQDGTRWIIDYKSSQPADGQTIEQFLTQEQQRYAGQLNQYAKSISLIEQRPIKLCLYFPWVQQLLSWDYTNVALIS